MIKRMKAALILLAAVLLVFAMPSAAFASEEDGFEEQQLKETAAVVMETVMGVCSDEASYQEIMGYRESQLDFILISGGYPVTAEDFKNLLTSWKAAQEECGAYAETNDLSTVLDSFTAEKTADGMSLRGQMAFADRMADITFSFDREGTMTALTAGGKYTTGEILKKAGLNTLIGMGTVFAVLILISLLISTFKYIPAITERFSKNSSVETAQTKETAANPQMAGPAAVNDAVRTGEPLKIPDGAVVNVRVRESQVTYVTVRERKA